MEEGDGAAGVCGGEGYFGEVGGGEPGEDAAPLDCGDDGFREIGDDEYVDYVAVISECAE